MVKNTIVDYIIAIKAKYEIEKLGYFHDYLNIPSPAQLRNLSLLKYEKGLSKPDLEIFEKFFNEKNNLEKVIFNFPLSKFKAIESFLVGVNKKTSPQNLNLIAILIDFSPRPFYEFHKSGYFEIQEETNKWPETDKTREEEIHGIKELAKEKFQEKTEKETHSKALISFESIVSPVKTNPTLDFFNNHKILSITGALIFFLSCFLSVKTLTKENQCMTWKKDHFEEIACDEIIEEGTGIVVPKDDYLIQNFKKIVPCDTTTYFRNGKPCVWYGKSPDGEYEYFTAPGQHPLTDKSLDEITEYMIKKHLSGKSD